MEPILVAFFYVLRHKKARKEKFLVFMQEIEHFKVNLTACTSRTSEQETVPAHIAVRDVRQTPPPTCMAQVD